MRSRIAVLIGVVLDNYLPRRRRTCINSAGVQILGTVSVSHSTGTRLGIHLPRRAVRDFLQALEDDALDPGDYPPGQRRG